MKELNMPCKASQCGNPMDGFEYECDYEFGDCFCEDCICTGGYYNPRTGKEISWIKRKVQDRRMRKIYKTKGELKMKKIVKLIVAVLIVLMIGLMLGVEVDASVDSIEGSYSEALLKTKKLNKELKSANKKIAKKINVKKVYQETVLVQDLGRMNYKVCFMADIKGKKKTTKQFVSIKYYKGMDEGNFDIYYIQKNDKQLYYNNLYDYTRAEEVLEDLGIDVKRLKDFGVTNTCYLNTDEATGNKTIFMCEQYVYATVLTKGGITGNYEAYYQDEQLTRVVIDGIVIFEREVE